MWDVKRNADAAALLWKESNGTGKESDVAIIITLFIITERTWTENIPNETEKHQNKTISH